MKVSGTGHSVVVDGYKIEKDGFKVHLNFGWGGEKDGWFNMFEDIATEGDTQLRFMVTVNPLRSCPLFEITADMININVSGQHSHSPARYSSTPSATTRPW